MKLPVIAYPSSPPGLPIPRWFTMLHHLWSRRVCRRVGHVRTHWPSCDYCGLRFPGSNERGGWAEHSKE